MSRGFAVGGAAFLMAQIERIFVLLGLIVVRAQSFGEGTANPNEKIVPADQRIVRGSAQEVARARRDLQAADKIGGKDEKAAWWTPVGVAPQEVAKALRLFSRGVETTLKGAESGAGVLTGNSSAPLVLTARAQSSLALLPQELNASATILDRFQERMENRIAAAEMKVDSADREADEAEERAEDAETEAARAREAWTKGADRSRQRERALEAEVRQLQFEKAGMVQSLAMMLHASAPPDEGQQTERKETTTSAASFTSDQFSKQGHRGKSIGAAVQDTATFGIPASVQDPTKPATFAFSSSSSPLSGDIISLAKPPPNRESERLAAAALREAELKEAQASKRDAMQIEERLAEEDREQVKKELRQHNHSQTSLTPMTSTHEALAGGDSPSSKSKAVSPSSSGTSQQQRSYLSSISSMGSKEAKDNKSTEESRSQIFLPGAGHVPKYRPGSSALENNKDAKELLSEAWAESNSAALSKGRSSQEQVSTSSSAGVAAAQPETEKQESLSAVKAPKPLFKKDPRAPIKLSRNLARFLGDKVLDHKQSVVGPSKANRSVRLVLSGTARKQQLAVKEQDDPAHEYLLRAAKLMDSLVTH